MKLQKEACVKSIESTQLRIAKNKALLAANPMHYFLNSAERDKVGQQMLQDAANLRANQKSLAQITKDLVNTEQKVAEQRASVLTFPANPFKFTQSATSNFMDYYNFPTGFFHWQWTVMQQDVATYYGS